MLLSSHQGLNYFSVRPRKSVQLQQQESQIQAKQYRSLLAIFTVNANSLIKRYRDCISDLDPFPKIKISKQELQSAFEQLNKIYPKHQEKISKDIISRNGNIKKSCYDYHKQFTSAFSDQKQQQKQEHFPEKQSITIEQKMQVAKFSSKKQFTNISNMKRPLSSKPKQNGMNILSQAYRTFQNSELSSTYKMKTFSGQVTQNPQSSKERMIRLESYKSLMRKTSFSKRKPLFQSQRFDSPKLDNKKQELFYNENEKQKSASNKDMFDVSLSGTGNIGDKIISLKFNQRRSINQIERMQVQNRIMMINSVLSVNLTQSQGYRPKSRCWQNYFN